MEGFSWEEAAFFIELGFSFFELGFYFFLRVELASDESAAKRAKEEEEEEKQENLPSTPPNPAPHPTHAAARGPWATPGPARRPRGPRAGGKRASGGSFFFLGFGFLERAFFFQTVV